MMAHSPPHPGRSVLEEYIEPLGLIVSETAARLGINRKQLSNLVRCRSRITPEIAIRLDKAFGGGTETWYRMQAIYDLAQVKKHCDAN